MLSVNQLGSFLKHHIILLIIVNIMTLVLQRTKELVFSTKVKEFSFVEIVVRVKVKEVCTIYLSV